MYRFNLPVIISLTVFLSACAGPAPQPEPGMEIIQHGRDKEMQVAQGVDWHNYTKIILHAAPVEFRDNWQSDQERKYGRAFHAEDMEKFKSAVSGQFSKVMIKKLTEQGDYELTSETGPGVMHFIPNIVELDIQAPGWVQGSIVESMSSFKGGLRIEMVVRDSVSNELLAVAWQDQSDPQQGYMDVTNTINNSVAFRMMMQNWANWFLKHFGETS